MKKKYICKEPVGWQFGNDFIGAGQTVELTDTEFAEYSKNVKLEPVQTTGKEKVSDSK